MIKFNKEKVLLLHQLIVEATGGTDGIRDLALLDSALESIYATSYIRLRKKKRQN